MEVTSLARARVPHRLRLHPAPGNREDGWARNRSLLRFEHRNLRGVHSATPIASSRARGFRGKSTCCLSSAKGCNLDNCTPLAVPIAIAQVTPLVRAAFSMPGAPHCGNNRCTSDSDCLGNVGGPRCDLDFADPLFDSCVCEAPSDCPAGSACRTDGGRGALCSPYCSSDSDCVSGYFCDTHDNCRPRCDATNHCQGPDTICDSANAAGQNGRGSDPSAIWCYACLQGSDCDGGLGCVAPGQTCQACAQDSDCASGACLDGTCLTRCQAGVCPGGQVCDAEGVAGRGGGFCYDYLGPIDCPGNQGCNSQSHTCGTCTGPNVDGGPFDCPPGTICSKYWSDNANSGVCLQYCDVFSCPDSQPICGTLPALTPDHKFCFGCLQNSDCADAGAGAVCDVSVDLTFACVNPLAP